VEATWAGHAAGTTLLHADIRADNVLLTGGGVVVVDWPHAWRTGTAARLAAARM
jgi:RIO-like serine/threonine protein kinase